MLGNQTQVAKPHPVLLTTPCTYMKSAVICTVYSCSNGQYGVFQTNVGRYAGICDISGICIASCYSDAVSAGTGCANHKVHDAHE